MVALLVLASVLSRIFGDVSAAAQQGRTGPQRTYRVDLGGQFAPPGSVVKPTKVTVFLSICGADNPGEADLAIDGNPAILPEDRHLY